MIKHLLLCIAILCYSGSLSSFAQNTLIIAEDFEGNSYIASINDTGLASNTGPNQWIINNQYSGGGIYPNTINQDSTYGGFITFPNGHYLHIHDSLVSDSIVNTNYDPAYASDRFAIVKEFCTLGYSDVTVAYYYLCMGDTNNAFGQVFYSIDNGTWTPFPGGIYTNTYKWKYTELIDPIFDNQSNVRIGFRWTNNSSNTPFKPSFAVDDLSIVGNFDNSLVGITMDTLQLVPVCQNFNFLAYFSLTNSLCGSGFYQVELSNASGNFNIPTSLGIYQLNNLSTFQELTINIPFNTPPGTCYQIRIKRIDVTPNVVSTISACFEVLLCLNTITTLAPVMLSNPLDTICVGSVIDVPFFSTGLYTNNTYVAQLSDSAGNFTLNPNILGTFANSQTYDPALGSLPGTVSGLLNPSFQPIPPGCNYYIRVISDNPSAIGSLYGPFCIRNCDIETNNQQDISACITTTAGFDTTAIVDINQFDSTAVYASNNLFQLQLLSSMSFGIVNTGGIGSINATGDTIMPITIPNLLGLSALGLQPGLYYARVVATNSSNMWNNLGTLIRVIIGAPADIPLSVMAYHPSNFTGFIPEIDTSICPGTGIYFTMLPFNASSDYVWTLNNQYWGTDQFTGVLFNQSGDFFMSVIETNYGCVGPVSDSGRVHVLSNPTASITGPVQVILNDTVIYSAQYNNANTYNWTCNNAIVVNNNNNIYELSFSNLGNYQVHCTASNMCTSSSSVKNISVISGLGNDEISTNFPIELVNNLSENTFKIKFNKDELLDIQYTVFETSGAQIYSNSIEGLNKFNSYDLQLSQLPIGLYFLKINTKNGFKIFKIIKI